MPPQEQPPQEPGPRLTRSRADRMVAGVAGGIAAHLRLSPALVRVIFMLLLPVNGLGALLYAVFWAVLPRGPEESGHNRRDAVRLLPFIAIGAGAMVISALVVQGSGLSVSTGWLVALIALGAGIIWHQADPSQRQRWSDRASPTSWFGNMSTAADRRIYLLRFLGGGLLVVVGVIGLIVIYSPVKGLAWNDIATAFVFALVALIGVGLVAAPVLWRMLTALRSEREGRIRERERAELAAMIHDQVLHTLALIQRNAADPSAVARLARGQERTLRNWLYQPTGSPTEHFAAALEQASAEVEDTYAIAVETVVVGDRAVDERVAALIAAAREALVNAARHAQVKTVSLYAEVEPGLLSVFVRDRGVGFDPSTVDDSENGPRHGVRGSIIGRMARHGGTAEIRSESGEGTEVRLGLPVSRESARQAEPQTAGKEES